MLLAEATNQVECDFETNRAVTTDALARHRVRRYVVAPILLRVLNASQVAVPQLGVSMKTERARTWVETGSG